MTLIGIHTWCRQGSEAVNTGWPQNPVCMLSAALLISKRGFTYSLESLSLLNTLKQRDSVKMWIALLLFMTIDELII